MDLAESCVSIRRIHADIALTSISAMKITMAGPKCIELFRKTKHSGMHTTCAPVLCGIIFAYSK